MQILYSGEIILLCLCTLFWQAVQIRYPEYETVKAEFSCNGHTFSASEKAVTHNGWRDFEDVFKRSFKIARNKEDENGKKKLSEGQTFEGV